MPRYLHTWYSPVFPGEGGGDVQEFAPVDVKVTKYLTVGPCYYKQCSCREEQLIDTGAISRIQGDWMENPP